MTPIRARATAVALLVVAAAACGRPPREATRTAPTPAREPHAPAHTADAHFMSAMIGHHAQAIEMARLALTHGAGPSIRALAERVINAQQDEIAIMQQWLRDRGLPVPEPRASATAAQGTAHVHPMPGMLTEAQMAQLDAARGKEFERLFLRFMIQHHEGAVEMVKTLFGSYGAAQDDTVFKLASDINVDQTTEITRMRQMLFMLELERKAP